MRYGCGKTDLRPHAVEIMKDRASSMERRSGRQASATDAGLTTTQPDTGTRVQAQLNPSSRDATQGPRSCGEAVRPWPIRKQGPYYRESWYRHVLIEFLLYFMSSSRAGLDNTRKRLLLILFVLFDDIIQRTVHIFTNLCSENF